MQAIEKAIQLAAVRHDGQVDKAGEPYILHPLSVMFRVRKAGADILTQIAAVLHDVLEDTETTAEEIEEQFGPEVAAAVIALTREPGESYQAYIQRTAMNSIARRVKVADLEDNLDLRRSSWASTAKENETLLSLRRRYVTALKALME